MAQKIFQFEDKDNIGVIAAVDTSRAIIDVSNSELLTRIGVGNLVAINGGTPQEFLIGVTETVKRSLKEDLSDDITSDEEVQLELTPKDHMSVALIGTFRTVDGDRKNTFKRGADTFPQIDRECYYLEGANLQRFMNLLGQGVKEEERLVLGKFLVDQTAEAVASGDKFFQRHAAILGSTGSGKSWTVALLLEKASNLGHPNIIVLDMHGEYAPLGDIDHGGFAQHYKIAGPGDLDAPDDSHIFLPYWMLNRDEMLSMILDRSDQNAPNQASRFTSHVRELKGITLQEQNQDEIAKTFTVDSPIPYQITDLVKKLSDDNTRKGVGANNKAVKGPWEDKLTRFLSRLEAKLEDRRYGFMFQPPKAAQEYGWLGDMACKLLSSNTEQLGIKIIDFSEVPPDVLPVVTGTFARLLYDIQFWTKPEDRTPISMVCDEAHLYLPKNENADAVERQALKVFERIAKEGRKYGFSLVAVSQRPSDVSRTILSQCNNFLSLRLTNDADQNVIKKLMPDSLAGLTAILPLLDVGEALLLGDSILLPSRIKLDVPQVKPDSATRDFWQEWSSQEPSSDAITAAVEALRGQKRS